MYNNPKCKIRSPPSLALISKQGCYQGWVKGQVGLDYSSGCTCMWGLRGDPPIWRHLEGLCCSQGWLSARCPWHFVSPAQWAQDSGCCSLVLPSTAVRWGPPIKKTQAVGSAGMQVCPILHGDPHDHVILGRAALWLHGDDLNAVAPLFCCPGSVQIHQAHALLSWKATQRRLGWSCSTRGKCLLVPSQQILSSS